MKDISSSSVKSNSRIPKPVSGENTNVQKQDRSNTRNLRSNSRSTPSSRPIRINRACLKGIPVTQDRVVKRTRPFIQKVKSTESGSTTPQTSAIMPRAPVPSAIKSQAPVPSVIKPRAPVARITSHSCVKPVISTTTTQISTRFLRSHAVSKTTLSVQSSKTDAVPAAKISTVNNTSTPTSTLILRNHSSPPRDTGTTSAKSNIGKFTWNLRSRSSVSKAVWKTNKDDEAKPLRKRAALKEAEGTTVGKRLALRVDGGLSSNLQKQEPQRPEIKKVPEGKSSRSEHQQKKIEVNLTKEQKPIDLKLTKPILVNADIKTLAVPQEKSLASAEHEAPVGQQTENRLVEQQVILKKSTLETKNNLGKLEIKTQDALQEKSLVSSKDKVQQTNTEFEEQQPSLKKFKQEKETEFSPGKLEIKILDVSQEKSLANAEHEVTAEPYLAKQPSVKTSNQELGFTGITPASQAKRLEERALASEDSEVKIVGKDTDASQGTPRQETIPSVKEPTVVEPTVVAKPLVQEQHLEERASTPEHSEVKRPGKVTEGTLSQVEENIPSVKVSTNDETIKSTKPFDIIETPLAKEIQASTVETPLVKKPQASTVEQADPAKDQPASDQKPASPKSSQAEIPHASKRKWEETSVCDGIPVVKTRLNKEIALKPSEVISKNCRYGSSIIVADFSTVKPPTASSGLEKTQTTSTATPNILLHVEADKLQASNSEKLFESPKAETPPVFKRKAEDESLCVDTPVVKPRLKVEIALTTSEVIPQNCRDESSTTVDPPAPTSGIEATLTTMANTPKPLTLAEAVKADQLPDKTPEKSSENVEAEPSTVGKEHPHPVITSTCSKPTIIAREQSSDAEKTPATLLRNNKPSLAQPKTIKPLETTADETRAKRRFKSTKRPASLTPIDTHLLVKKRRSTGSENGQDKSTPFALPVQSCSSQTMDIESPTPAASNQDMEIDPSGNGSLRIVSNLVFNHIPPAINTQSGQDLSEDMELSESSQILPFTFGTTQQQSRPTFGNQPVSFSLATPGQQAGQSFGLNQPTNPQFCFGNTAIPQNSSVFQRETIVNGFNQIGSQSSGLDTGNTFGNVPQLPRFASGVFNQATNQAQQITFGSVPRAPPLPTGGSNQTGNQVFGNLPRQNQPISGVSFNQTNSPQIFGNPPTLNMRPTLVNSDGSPRKFFSTKGYRRRNAAKTRFNPNQATNQTTPLVFANGLQPGPGFSMVVQSPILMESEDVSTSSRNISGNGSVKNQPSNVQNRQLFGQKNGYSEIVCGSLQTTSGQNLNDHPMEEESVQTTPSLMVSNGTLPPRTTVSCFAISSQTRTTLERTLSLPQIALTTSTVDIPTAPPSSLLQPARLQLPSSRGTSTNISSETSTNHSHKDTLCEPKLKVGVQSSSTVGANQANATTLHKIYSSVSSLSSSSSSLSDCQSEIDALIENLSESVSNCSLEDSPAMDDIGKLIEKFKTLSIADTPLNTVEEA